VRGKVAGSDIQAQDSIFVDRAGRSTLHTEGSIFFGETLRQCDIIACKHVIGLGRGAIVGGVVNAGGRVHAAEIGASDGMVTEVIIGSDRLSMYRLEITEQDIQAVKMNASKITQSLRPFGSMTDKLPPDKKKLVDTLLQQRSQLEKRLDELYAVKRSALIGSHSIEPGPVTVSGTIHAGAHFTLGGESLKVGESVGSAELRFDPVEKTIKVTRLATSRHGSTS
jgi:uncharacterized protein (DUF342 family)